MKAYDFLNTTLPTLKLNDSVAKALEWMEEFHITQLPVAEDNTYLGIINYETLLNSDEDLLLKNVVILYSNIFISPQQHIFEALSIAQKYELETVALQDDEQNYLGYIVISNLQKHVSFEMMNTKEIGAILELEIENHNYSLTEISRLIEMNNIKILNLFYSSITTAGKNTNILTLKLNTKDISRLLATLERYEYAIKNVYANEKIQSENKERYDHLMKYLEI